MRALIFLILASLISTNTWAQTASTPEKKVNVGIEGMLGASVAKDFYAFNVGGPSLQLTFNKDFKIGVGALPSLYVKDGNLGAKLSVAPRVDYKSLVFFVPFFHFENANKWIASFGVGYKFYKKN